MLFVAIKPGLDAMTSIKDVQCCSGSACAPALEIPFSDTQKENNTEQNNTCTPGHTCACCLFICSTIITHTFISQAIPTEIFFGHETPLTSNYTADFWQPPKFV